MKRIAANEWTRYPLAVAAGLLWAAAFPNWGIAGLAWLVPALMLVAGMGLTGPARFRVGFVAGFAHHLAALSWLLNIPVRFFPVLGWLALAGYLAIYPGLWVWLSWRFYPAKLEAGAWWEGRVWDSFLRVNGISRMAWTGTGAALWVANEMILGRFLSGFPWNFLGASQYRMVPLIQLASYAGVYGVSFLVVWFSASFLGTFGKLLRQSQSRRMWLGEIALPMLAAVLLLGWGFRRALQPIGPQRMVKIALMQPSIPQTTMWDPREDASRFRQLIELSEKALASKPDLMLWPEAGTPGYARWDTNVYSVITNLVRRHSVWLMLGSDDVALRSSSPMRPGDEVDYFNAAFLVNPEGEFVASYHKRKLVIFGEYVPLARQLPFLKWFTPIQGGFTPGSGPVSFRLDRLRLNASPLICFEDNFPEFVRAGLEDDTDLLVNLTNNGWFGEGAAQWQHAANAIFRAVEDGLPLIRCSNNGLSCWIDPVGRVRDFYFTGSPANIYGPGFKIVDVPIPSGPRPPQTYYRRFGDRFGWACVAWIGWRMVRSFWIRKKEAL